MNRLGRESLAQGILIHIPQHENTPIAPILYDCRYQTERIELQIQLFVHHAASFRSVPYEPEFLDRVGTVLPAE